MAKPGIEDESLRRRVVEEMAEGEQEQEERAEKVDRDDWLHTLFSKEHQKESEIAAHNFNVALFNSLLSYARKVRDLSSKRPMYFINQETGDLVIEVETKRFGLIPPEIRSSTNTASDMSIDNLLIDSDEEIELVDQGYEILDEDDWFLLSFQNVNNINQITAKLSIELEELDVIREEVMTFEERSGLSIDFYFIGDSEDDPGLSYSVRKKRKMGFVSPKPSEKIDQDTLEKE
jgi:hypothetical protein